MALPNGLSGATLYGAFGGDFLAADHMGWVSKHDVVYRRAPSRPDDGVPVGNGALGGLLWIEDGVLKLQANSAEFRARTGERPLGGLLTGACFEFLSEPSPLRSTSSYLQRLDLGQAVTSLTASSAAGTSKARLWAPATADVLLLEYEDSLVRAKRRILRATGDRNARPFAIDSYVGVSEEAEDRRLAVLARVLGVKAEPAIDEHGPALRIESQRGVGLQVVIAAACTGKDRDPVREARFRIESALRTGAENLFREHRAHWRNFWSKSFLKLHSEDGLADYAENLWYLHLYYLASCSRGESPPAPAGGLWRTGGSPIPADDALLHWATQVQYWPVIAANHLELLQPYHSAMAAMLPAAEGLAASRFGASGAWFPPALSASGEEIPLQEQAARSAMLTSGAEHAMSLWWTWQHTQDYIFLRDLAYPVLSACARFLVERAETGPDGNLQLARGDAYLRRLDCANPTPDLAALRFALPALAQAASALGLGSEEAQFWERALASLPQNTLNPGRDTWDDGDEGEPGIEIGRPDLAPVFPACDVGIGSPEHERAVRTLALGYGECPYVGWSNEPVSAARLGLHDDMESYIRHHIRHCQFGAQGFFHRVPDPDYLGPSLDCSGALAAAMNEICVQSVGGVIRVFAALPRKWDASFQLRVAGGFVVLGEAAGGNPVWLGIRSLCGMPVRLRNPWCEHMRVTVNGKEALRSAAPVADFPTKRDQTYLVEKCSRPISRRMTRKLTASRNESVKQCGPRRLGRE